jgi:hypothetical protein
LPQLALQTWLFIKIARSPGRLLDLNRPIFAVHPESDIRAAPIRFGANYHWSHDCDVPCHCRPATAGGHDKESKAAPKGQPE